MKIGGRVRANQRVPELVRVGRVFNNCHGIADVRFVPFDRGGGATAKDGEALARTRRVPRSVFPEDEMLVRNPVDAAESFLSIGGLISIR